jgi:hypothetical protein
MGLNMVGASVIVPDSSDGTDPENPYADGKKTFSSISDIKCKYNFYFFQKLLDLQ